MIPQNEIELIILFAQQAGRGGFEIVKAQSAFPDAIIRRFEIEYRVEFEFRASNFWLHRHNPLECDLIICWENDDPYQVVPIIALNNSEWYDIDIVLPSYQEKTISYWKSRATKAEKYLDEINSQISDESKALLSIEEKLERKKNELEKLKQDEMFRQLVIESGMSKRQASLIAYNRPYGGDIHKRGLIALASTTTTGSRNGSISTEK